MKSTPRLSRLLRLAACLVVLQATWPGGLNAQQQPAASATEAQAFSAEQLDALLAPIALYPDELLVQILMAATYPLQVVEAARWVDDPAHTTLSGDALTRALTPLSWDPSVKSLVPFPQVLTMMNAKLDWLQQLGYAVSVREAEVFDSIQRLRQQAQASGHLQSTPEQAVRSEQQAIVIEPAQPNVVYVPSYDPNVVYGAWPHPTYPPVYLPPPPPGYVAGRALAAGLAFGAGVAIAAGLWGWARPAWRARNVTLNVNRWNSININRRRIAENVWRPRPTPHRAAARPSIGPVGVPERLKGLPTSAIGHRNVSVPSRVVNHPGRPAGAQLSGRPRAGAVQLGRERAAKRPQANARPGRSPAAANLPNRARTAGPNSHQRSFQFNSQARTSARPHGARGAESRQFQHNRPSAGAGPRAHGGGIRAHGRS